MNIAFSALFILFLALPGILLCYAYRHERGRPVGTRPLADEIPIGMTFAVILHTLWVILFDKIGPHWAKLQVDLNSAFALLAAQYGKDGADFKQISASVLDENRPLYIVSYFISLCIASAGIGLFFRWTVKCLELDRRFQFLRWNDWYYLLRGESPPDQPAINEKFDCVWVTVVVEEYIYGGFVADYVINRDGVLDSIVVGSPERRKLCDDEVPGQVSTFYSIPVDYLALKYEHCKDLAIQRRKLPPATATAPAPAPAASDLQRQSPISGQEFALPPQGINESPFEPLDEPPPRDET